MADRILIELGRSHQIKDLKVALQCLAKIGSDLLIEGDQQKLVLRTINTAKSAIFTVTFYSTFFDGYTVESQSQSVVQSAVLLKHVLATFRTQKLLSMSMNLDAGQSKLTVTVIGDNRMSKTYELDCMNSEVLNAAVDKESYPTQVIAEAGELNRLLNSFQSSLDEITIIANPERTASAASMHRCCQLQSFYDPEKGGRENILHTSLVIDTQSVFVGYRHRSDSSSDATFNVKDFRSIVTFCEHQGSNIMLRLHDSGMPVVAETHAQGPQPEAAYKAELVLATLSESQLPAAAAHHQAPQQQEQAAVDPHRHQQHQQHQQLQQPVEPAGPAAWAQPRVEQQQSGVGDEPAVPRLTSSFQRRQGQYDDDEDGPEEAGARDQDLGTPRAAVMEWDDPDPEQLPRTGRSPLPGPKSFLGTEASVVQHQGVHTAQFEPLQHQPAAAAHPDRTAALSEAYAAPYHDAPAHGNDAHVADVAVPVAQVPMQVAGEYGHGEDEDDVLPSTPDEDGAQDQGRGLMGPGFIAD